MKASIARSWQQIASWLREHAPATAQVIRPPAPAEEVRHLQQVVGLDLPADLLAWWAVMDGVDDNRDYRAGALIPSHFMPLSVARAQEEHVRLLASSALDPGCCAPDNVHHKQAGDTGFPFCTALVPICRAVDGCLLCVDLRPGDDHACITNWAADEGFYPSEWTSVTDMLTEVAERLHAYAHGHELPPFEQHPFVDDEGILR